MPRLPLGTHPTSFFLILWRDFWAWCHIFVCGYVTLWLAPPWSHYVRERVCDSANTFTLTSRHSARVCVYVVVGDGKQAVCNVISQKNRFLDNTVFPTRPLFFSRELRSRSRTKLAHQQTKLPEVWCLHPSLHVSVTVTSSGPHLNQLIKPVKQVLV